MADEMREASVMLFKAYLEGRRDSAEMYGSADDQEWVKLASVWLEGYNRTDENGVASAREFVDKKDEKPHRRALAMLLLSGKPLPLRICMALAEQIAPDDTEIASERRLEFRFRNRSRTKPLSGYSGATARRDEQIEANVEFALRQRKITVEEAVEAVAEELRLTVATVWRVWKRRVGGRRLISSLPLSLADPSPEKN